MSYVSLVPGYSNPAPGVRGKPASHPCLEAFRQEFDYLIRTLRRLGVPGQDVEDLAHEVFLVLHRTWNSYDPTRSLRAYLFGIAFKVSCSHFRKSKREFAREAIEIQDLGPRPDQEVETSQQRSLLLKAIEQVSLRPRAVLVMHDIDEMPMVEIAANLSIPRFTAYSRLRRARKELMAAVAVIFRTNS